MHVICLGWTVVTWQGTPSRITLTAKEFVPKGVPVMVTVSPPAVEPYIGEMLWMTGVSNML
jgi:hypothetical protein